MLETMDNPLTGYAMTFLEETVERFRFRELARPGAPSPALQEERFEVIRGTVAFEMGGRQVVCRCEPFAFPCLNDPNAQTGGTLSTSHTIGGNLIADDSLAVLTHHNSIGRNLASRERLGPIARPESSRLHRP